MVSAVPAGEVIERDEAVGDWYDSVYVPVVRAIRDQGALEHFPGRTEADLYRWIMDRRGSFSTCVWRF